MAKKNKKQTRKKSNSGRKYMKKAKIGWDPAFFFLSGKKKQRIKNAKFLVGTRKRGKKMQEDSRYTINFKRIYT